MRSRRSRWLTRRVSVDFFASPSMASSRKVFRGHHFGRARRCPDQLRRFRMTAYRIIGGALSVGLFLACRAAPAADLATPCEWGLRDSVRPDGEYVYVEPPLTTMLAGDLVMLGESTLQRTLAGGVLKIAPGVYNRAGLRIDSRGKAYPIDLPAGVKGFHHARITSVRDHAVSVIWQGGRTLSDTGDSRLWTVTLDSSGWSELRLVADTPVDDIGLSYGSPLVAYGEDLAIVTPQAGSSTALFIRRAGIWRRHQFPGVQALYATLAASRQGFLLGVIDADAFKFASLSVDGTVGPFTVVAAANGRDFHYPFILVADSSRIIAAWVEGAASERTVIRAAHSDDHGASWKARDGLLVEGGLQSFDAILRNGIVYAAGRGSTPDGPWPFVAAFDAEAWHVLPVPRAGHEIGIVSPRFSRIPESVEVYWAASENARRVSQVPPALVRVRLQHDCLR